MVVAFWSRKRFMVSSLCAISCAVGGGGENEPVRGGPCEAAAGQAKLPSAP